jgi:hypothetical protein
MTLSISAMIDRTRLMHASIGKEESRSSWERVGESIDFKILGNIKDKIENKVYLDE